VAWRIVQDQAEYRNYLAPTICTGPPNNYRMISDRVILITKTDSADERSVVPARCVSSSENEPGLVDFSHPACMGLSLSRVSRHFYLPL
jgi:hypothetical protein